MEWLELVKVGADLGFIVLCAGLILFFVWDMYKSKKTKEQQTTARVVKMEDGRQQQYEELIKNLQTKTEEFYSMLKKDREEMEDKYDKLVQQIIDQMKVPHILSREENEKMTKIDDEINFFLDRVLQICKASRVCLIKYHNGGVDMNGNSILKMSITNEKCAAGVLPIQGNFQNQLRSAFAYWVKQLNDNGYCFIHNIDNIENVDNSMYQYMKQVGTKAKFGISIQSRDKVPIGYLTIDFMSMDDINFEQVKHCLEDKKIKIETLMNL